MVNAVSLKKTQMPITEKEAPENHYKKNQTTTKIESSLVRAFDKPIAILMMYCSVVVNAERAISFLKRKMSSALHTVTDGATACFEKVSRDLPRIDL